MPDLKKKKNPFYCTITVSDWSLGQHKGFAPRSTTFWCTKVVEASFKTIKVIWNPKIGFNDENINILG